IRVDQHHLSIRADRAENLARVLVQNAIERAGRGGWLLETHALIGSDVESAPVEVQLLRGLVDERLAVARGGNRALPLCHDTAGRTGDRYRGYAETQGCGERHHRGG